MTETKHNWQRSKAFGITECLNCGTILKKDRSNAETPCGKTNYACKILNHRHDRDKAKNRKHNRLMEED